MHGTGQPNGYGLVRIGTSIIMDDEQGNQLLARLRVLAPLFAPYADVFIMACKTGNYGKVAAPYPTDVERLHRISFHTRS